MPDLSGGTPSLKALQNGQTTAAAETAAALSEPPVQEIKQTPEQHLPAAAASVSGPSPQPVVSMPAGSPLSAFESEAKVKYLPLSEPNVVKKWNEFAENYRSQASEYAILRNKEPKLDGSQVSVEMTNKLESTQFDKLRLATQAFLKAAFGPSLSLVSTIAEQKEVKMIYTPSQKMAYLIEKYPAVAELQARFEAIPDA